MIAPQPEHSYYTWRERCPRIFWCSEYRPWYLRLLVHGMDGPLRRLFRA
jgi:hypothetical protein